MPTFPSTLPGILCLLFYIRATSAHTVFSNDPPDSCVIIGDPDLYGIGVRLSYYLSFSAAVLATIFGLTDELSGTRRGMIIITTAALIDTIFSNIRGSFAILEWYIVGLETLGLAGPVFWPSFVKRKVKRKDGDEERKEGVEYDFDDSTKADAGLFGMFGTIEVINLCLAPWIYFSLHDQGYKKSCKVTTFFFASFDIGARGWTIYMRIQAIINIVGGIFWILVCGWLLYYAIRASWKQKESEEVEEGDEKASSTSQWLDRIGKAFVMIIFGAISAYFAERVIHDNSISMDDATLASGSQLIPFLVGLFNFVVIVGKCIITAHSSHSKVETKSTSKRSSIRGSESLTQARSSAHGHGVGNRSSTW